MKNLFLYSLIAFFLPPQLVQAADPHSYSKPSEVRVKHISLKLNVDFEKKELMGTATLSIQNKLKAKTVFLDTRGIVVESITDSDSQKSLAFALGKVDDILGAPLIVDLNPTTQKITIAYHTTKDSTALQWFEPAQTFGRTHPFLLTQSESIHARSWIPCQDSPQVRVTYDATISVPSGLTVVMSAERQVLNARTFGFKMSHPIAPYLIALAVGNLRFKELSNRSGIWSEPEILDRAVDDFKDTEKALRAAESLYGKYDWGRADLLVNPSGFPYGGMENPGMIFLTPTLLTGDGSLFNVVAHELAHSWSGNKVTNATWADFWLNESFTVYTELRILEKLYGRDFSEMKTKLGLLELQEEFANLLKTAPEDTHLRVNFAGRHPDEIPSATAYEKGALFLWLIEETVGRQRFDAFLNSWFKTYRFQSVTTDDFIAFLRKNLIKGSKDLEDKLQIEAWIDGPGLPSNAPIIHSKKLEQVEGEIDRFVNSHVPASQLKTKDWSSTEMLYFVKTLPVLSKEQMVDLDQTYQLTKSTNSEILFAWLKHGIQTDYEPCFVALEDFLLHVGRNKFIKNLYIELAKTPKGLEFAKRVYVTARPRYHAFVQRNVDKELH